MPERKELHHFGQDVTGPPAHDPVKDRDRYLAFFRDAGDRPRVGEASPFYLSSRTAAEEIAAFRPDARIVVMLRNPVDLAYSLYSTGFFPDLRARGILAYVEHEPVDRLVRNLAHVHRFLARFPAARIHVALYDDLVATPDALWRALCAFLEVEASFTPAFTAHAASRVPRSRTLGAAVSDPASFPRRIARGLLPIPRLRRPIRDALWRLVTRPPQPLDTALRRTLQARYAEEIAGLSALLGRDLTTWRD